MTTQTIVTVAVASLLGGGLLTAVVAAIKVKPENTSLLVSASKELVVMQGDVLDGLRAQLAATEARLTDLESRLETVTRERDGLIAENGALRDRVASLELQVDALRARDS